MKKFALFLSLILTQPALAQAPQPQSHWPLTADCQDVVGANDCAMAGSGTFTSDGLRFNGAHATLPQGMLNNLSAMTVIWDQIVPSCPTADGRVLDTGGGEGGVFGIALGLNKRNCGEIMLQISRADNFDNSAHCRGLYSTGVKQRLAVTYDGATGTTKCYRLGALVVTDTGYAPGRPIAKHTRTPLFGNRGSDLQRPFEGTIGNVVFAGRVWTDQEIADEAGATLPPPGNRPPNMVINEPANGSTFAFTETILFRGTASDTEDGDQSAFIEWSSSQDGFLGTGASILVMLSEGTSIVTAMVTDSGGLSGSDQVTVTANMTGEPGGEGQAPYPPSAAFSGIQWDQSSLQLLAPGSDNWAITSCPDGNRYVSWGDGGGFGGTDSRGRVSLGFARLEGDDPATFVGKNVFGGFESENPATLEGKSYGMLCLEDVMYAWWGPGSGDVFTDEVRLLRSFDLAATWERSASAWTRSSDGICCATFLNRGWKNAAARDDFVYAYFTRSNGVFDMQIPGEVFLARARTAGAFDKAAYEWFAGFDISGNPTWASTVPQARPVFKDPNGVLVASVTYMPELGLYALTSDHDAAFAGNLGVFVGPEPWGPWETVQYSTNFLGHTGTIAYYIAPGWSRGLSFTMVFTSSDHWASMIGRLVPN